MVVISVSSEFGSLRFTHRCWPYHISGYFEKSNAIHILQACIVKYVGYKNMRILFWNFSWNFSCM